MKEFMTKGELAANVIPAAPGGDATFSMRTFDDSDEANAWERDDRPLRGALNAYVDCVVRRASGDPRYKASEHADLAKALDAQIDALFEERRQISVRLGCPSRHTGLLGGATVIGYALENTEAEVTELRARLTAAETARDEARASRDVEWARAKRARAQLAAAETEIHRLRASRSDTP